MSSCHKNCSWSSQPGITRKKEIRGNFMEDHRKDWSLLTGKRRTNIKITSLIWIGGKYLWINPELVYLITKFCIKKFTLEWRWSSSDTKTGFWTEGLMIPLLPLLSGGLRMLLRLPPWLPPVLLVKLPCRLPGRSRMHKNEIRSHPWC